MKKCLLFLFALTTLAFTSCSEEFDDSAIWEKLTEHEERIAELETLCNQMNTNIEALQALIEVLEKRDYITHVADVLVEGEVVGYTISFAYSDNITIYMGQDGQDGQDGYTPQVGVKQDTDDLYYWTLDGDWLLDANGQKVRAQGVDGQNGTDGEDGIDGEHGQDGQDGITPQLKIEEEYWYISYDNGLTWEQLGKATGEDGQDGQNGQDGMISKVEEFDYEVVFTLIDGTTIIIPKGEAVSDNRMIYYTTTDGNKLFPANTNPELFGAILISNTYKEGVGVLTFDDEVTLLGNQVFSSCEKLASITIPESVTSIGEEAFYGCSNLEEFKGKFASADGASLVVNGKLSAYAPSGRDHYEIPEGVTSIENGVFSGCSNLAGVTLPESVTSIKTSAFSDCSALKRIYCKPATPPAGSDSMFSGNASGRKIYVPTDSVEDYKAAPYWSDYAADIVGYTFENHLIYYTNGSTTEATTPYTESGFGANLLSNLYNEEKGCWVMTFDGDVTSIPEEAFYFCMDLVSITLPDTVTSIGAYGFHLCSALTNITLPEAVTSIGSTSFYYCISLTSINIPEGVTAIENSTFHSCSGLKSITLPESVTSVGSAVFSGCSSLEEFKGKFASADGKCLVIDGVLHSFAQAGVTDYTIPENVTSIGDRGFYNCLKLVSITIPENVMSIGNEAFTGCTGLESFNGKFASTDSKCLIVDNVLLYYAPVGLTEYAIPDGVTSIGKRAFFRCQNLENITIPQSVTTIGNESFSGCTGITSVTIPESVTSIKRKAFEGCSALASVYCKPINPPTPESLWGAFAKNASDRKIYVPMESVEAYQTATWWKDYAADIVGKEF